MISVENQSPTSLCLKRRISRIFATPHLTFTPEETEKFIQLRLKPKKPSAEMKDRWSESVMKYLPACDIADVIVPVSMRKLALDPE